MLQNNDDNTVTRGKTIGQNPIEIQRGKNLQLESQNTRKHQFLQKIALNIKKNLLNKINSTKNAMIFSCVNLTGEKLSFDRIHQS